MIINIRELCCLNELDLHSRSHLCKKVNFFAHSFWQTSQSSWIEQNMLLQHVSVFKCMLIIFHSVYDYGREHYMDDFTFKFWMGTEVYQLISFKLDIILDTFKLDSRKPL